MSVFVVGLNGCRLMPTSERKARLLLKEGKASVYRKVPFTIKLNYKTGSTVQPGYLGIDTGSQHIGITIVREDGTVLHKEEIGLRDSMTKRKLLEAKSSLRRGRRYRKTRYRHPKWRLKTKRVYCEKPDRKGRHWKKQKNTFTSRRQAGWLPQYLVTVCSGCHTLENHQPGGILYRWKQEQKKFTRGLRDATFMNILRKRLTKAFPDAVFTYGNITKVDREALGLPKSHANDATAIALVRTRIISVKDNEPVIHIQQVRRKKRSLHEENPRKGRKEPNRTASRNSKNTKSVTVNKKLGKKKVPVTACLFDRVELDGRKGWISGFTGTACYVKDKQDGYVCLSEKYKQTGISKLRILHHCGNWVIGAETSLGKG